MILFFLFIPASGFPATPFDTGWISELVESVHVPFFAQHYFGTSSCTISNQCKWSILSLSTFSPIFFFFLLLSPPPPLLFLPTFSLRKPTFCLFSCFSILEHKQIRVGARPFFALGSIWNFKGTTWKQLLFLIWNKSWCEV